MGERSIVGSDGELLQGLSESSGNFVNQAKKKIENRKSLSNKMQLLMDSLVELDKDRISLFVPFGKKENKTLIYRIPKITDDGDLSDWCFVQYLILANSGFFAVTFHESQLSAYYQTLKDPEASFDVSFYSRIRDFRGGLQKKALRQNNNIDCVMTDSSYGRVPQIKFLQERRIGIKQTKYSIDFANRFYVQDCILSLNQNPGEVTAWLDEINTYNQKIITSSESVSNIVGQNISFETKKKLKRG